jgi:hypothetical protein
MISAPYAVTAAAGLPETVLPDSLVSQLPASVAAAPWHTRCQVVTWYHPAEAATIEAFPDAIRPDGVALVAWALVRYADTPVGPYSEVAATLMPNSGEYGHIPFIVVDSLPSIVGGRVNWLLPKALARFDWSDDGLSVTATADAPAEPLWRIAVRCSPSGDPTPTTLPSRVAQASTDGVIGRADGEMNGSLTSATIEVDGHADGPLAALLRPGTYDGALMSDCTFEVGPLVTN